MMPARHLLIAGFALLLATSVDAQVARAVSDAPGNAAISDGSTPLHQAVRANDVKIVDALIKRGVDVKAVTRYGVTPQIARDQKFN